MKPLRKCRGCGLEAHTYEDLELFVSRPGRNKHGRDNFCKKCQSGLSKDYNKKNSKENYKKAKEKREERKELVKSYLGGEFKCSHCGFTHDTLAPFDFHHINPEEKEQQVTHLLNCSLDRLLKEIDKCVLLCATCHRLEHERLRNE